MILSTYKYSVDNCVLCKYNKGKLIMNKDVIELCKFYLTVLVIKPHGKRRKR